MQYLTSTLLTLPILASAAVLPRAGAPVATPLPSGCPITAVSPSPSSSAFVPTESFESANGLYSFFLSPGATLPNGTDDATATQNCLETCYSFGNPGQCKSVWSGHNAAYDGYGGTSNQEFVCRLYGADITPDDLTPVEGGEDTNAHAKMIGCVRGQ